MTSSYTYYGYTYYGYTYYGSTYYGAASYGSTYYGSTYCGSAYYGLYLLWPYLLWLCLLWPHLSVLLPRQHDLGRAIPGEGRSQGAKGCSLGVWLGRAVTSASPRTR